MHAWRVGVKQNGPDMVETPSSGRWHGIIYLLVTNLEAFTKKKKTNLEAVDKHWRQQLTDHSNPKAHSLIITKLYDAQHTNDSFWTYTYAHAHLCLCPIVHEHVHTYVGLHIYTSLQKCFLINKSLHKLLLTLTQTKTIYHDKRTTLNNN